MRDRARFGGAWPGNHTYTLQQIKMRARTYRRKEIAHYRKIGKQYLLSKYSNARGFYDYCVVNWVFMVP